MELDLDYTDGQTPLEEEEKEGLLIPTIATRGELDEFEQQNIEQAVQWTLGHSFKREAVLTEAFIKKLHKRMYGGVWKWAGELRKSNKNIGVDKWLVPTQLRQLLNDTLFWMKNETFPPDEIAIRFKQRLVSIHCFANGNGRHSRLMADILIEKIYGRPVFSWGAGDLVHQGEARKLYIKAVKAADSGDLLPLLHFARS